MALQLQLYRQHWIFMGLIIGAVLVLLAVLTYQAMWTSRKVEEEKAQPPITSLKRFFIWFHAAFPWILIVTIASAIIFQIVYPIIRAFNPPNW